ncbi:phage tail fiber protein [Pontitalea aquivivens]|uniref:phage tail fiber protein n=1 Tax=Pontitalea aquivivens TaxID=3388663 RepID=UPI003970B95B
MSSFSDYLENALLNHVFRNTALSAPPAVYMALFTASPSDAGGGTEVAAAGYARQAVSFGAPVGGAIANTAAVAFTATGTAFGTIVAVGFFDALSGGNMLAWDDIASAAIGPSDTIEFPVGDIDITLT